jgi:iduronate 2-sulfatase
VTGLPLPDHLQGSSFVPLMKKPDMEWKAAAIGRYQNGDTVRTDQYRFTEYTGVKGNFLARMLYDHENDPGENINVSEQKGNKPVVDSLAKQLHQGMGKDQK